MLTPEDPQQPRGSVVEVGAWDGGQRIAHFPGLDLRGDQPDVTLTLDDIAPFERGLDVALTLSTPLGFATGFVFRSAGVTLVTAAGVLDVVAGGTINP